MESKEIRQCRHCGNRVVFVQRDSYYQYRQGLPNDGESHRQWLILECPVCAELTLEQIYYVLDDVAVQSEYRNFEISTQVLYPPMRVANLPEAIEKAYRAALKVRHVEPNACAVLVGRTLETVCRHEKAVGNTLADKLTTLANSGRIPQTLAQMAQQLRLIRNLAAHVAEDEVTEQDVPIIIDFLEAILEYLYYAPSKIAALQARLKKAPRA